jgi:hypothetical protein
VRRYFFLERVLERERDLVRLDVGDLLRLVADRVAVGLAAASLVLVLERDGVPVSDFETVLVTLAVLAGVPE